MNDNKKIKSYKINRKMLIMSSFKIIYVIQIKLMIYEDLIHYFQWLMIFNTVTTLG